MWKECDVVMLPINEKATNKDICLNTSYAPGLRMPLVHGFNECDGTSNSHLPDNTINIQSTKDSWTREEVIKFGLKCVDLGMNLNNNPLPRLNEMSGKDYYYKWIKQNL